MQDICGFWWFLLDNKPIFSLCLSIKRKGFPRKPMGFTENPIIGKGMHMAWIFFIILPLAGLILGWPFPVPAFWFTEP
jgi:hypothetical protein